MRFSYNQLLVSSLGGRELRTASHTSPRQSQRGCTWCGTHTQHNQDKSSASRHAPSGTNFCCMEGHLGTARRMWQSYISTTPTTDARMLEQCSLLPLRAVGRSYFAKHVGRHTDTHIPTQAALCSHKLCLAQRLGLPCLAAESLPKQGAADTRLLWVELSADSLANQVSTAPRSCL